MNPPAAPFRSAHAEDNGFSPRPGFLPFDPADAESTMGARFRETALRHGPRLAVADGDARMTYADLLARAEAIAADLRSRHGDGGGVVAICLPSALASIETMLGALLGGFGYFCLDSSAPERQKIDQLRVAGPIALFGESIQAWSGAARGVNTHGPQGIAALYATSGSTGEPKLVAWPHRAILFDIGRQTNDLYLGPDDRFDSLFPFAFSASLATVFGALLHGAELHCHEPRHDLGGLPAWLGERSITISTMTVSMLRHVCLLRPPPGSLASLRLLSVGGEALRSSDVQAFRSIFPRTCVLQNAMASTEARTYAQYFVPAHGPVENPVPIGWPVAGKEISLSGASGEIVVRSRYLAAGYFEDGNSAAKFETLPDGTSRYRTGDCGRLAPDGSLLFVGRADAQVKIRGFRVELEHIAQTLEQHPCVRAAAVIVDEAPDGNQRLLAYVVAEPAPGELALRGFLRDYLPDYSLPSEIVFLPELPLNTNFKLDRKRLLVPPAPAQLPGGELSAIEIVREIWAAVLQRSDIPDDGDFSKLGGDSLSAVRVLVAIRERLHCDLPPDSLHRYPALSQLAACVDQAMRGEAPADPVIPFHTGGTGCPIFFVAGMGGSAHGFDRLAQRVAPLHPAYGLNTSGGFDAAPGVSMAAVAEPLVEQMERIVPRGGTAALVGYSFGGTIAFEIARQLRARGRIDPLPILIDMPAMNAPGAPARTVARRLMDVLLNLPAWAVYECAHFDLRSFRLRASGHLARIARALGLLPNKQEFDPRIYWSSPEVPDAYRAVLNGMHRALLAYAPEAYDGRVILLRARVPTLFRTADRQMGWQFVAKGGVEVFPIAGRHGDCMSEEREPELAALLMQCVSGVCTPPSPPEFEASPRAITG